MRTETPNSNRNGKEERIMGITNGRRPKVPWVAAVFLAALLLAPMTAGAATPAGTAITNAATVNYQDAAANNYSAVSNTTTVTVTSVFSVSVNSPPDQSVPSNTVAYYAYTVTNTGNDNNTFALSAASGAGGNSWTVTLYADDGAGGGTANDGVHQAGETTVINSTGVLADNTTYRFFLAVTVPVGTANGQADDSVLTVTGSGDPGAGDDTSDTVTTTAQAPALSVVKNVRNATTGGTFDNTANAAPSQVLEYRITVANNGTQNATSVVLTDSDNANTTYVPGSMRIGPSSTYAGAGNQNPGDGTGDTTFPNPCNIAACGHGHVDGSGNVTAYLGNTAGDGAAGPGGTLTNGQTIYVFFQVTVD